MPAKRSEGYLTGVDGMGMAATRVDERVACAFGLNQVHPQYFEHCQSVPLGGVLLLLPFLIECGLLTYREHYEERKGYYDLDSLVITLSFIYLLRIKSIESSKHYNPGELGKLIGYDRIAEVKTLRGMVRELTKQRKCSDWSNTLANKWIGEETPELYYIDGHVQVYHGQLARLGKKHVSRQRLCLPGMMEFWVNGMDGLPFFFITAEINEKMIEMLEKEIIPQLLQLHVVDDKQRNLMIEHTDYPLFTLIFDREAYSPEFFQRLWENYRIAVITYRKNVKSSDLWDECQFNETEIETRLETSTMSLAEKEITLNGCSIKEVRRLCDDGHQTSIITTNRILTIVQIAAYMFGRWVQENFFRYLRQEYSFDKIIQYSIDELDNSLIVVNREYSNIQSKIKKMREKLYRVKAKEYDHQQKMPENNTDGTQSESINKWMTKQLKMTEQITQISKEIAELVEKRKSVPYKIPIREMPTESRYTKLHQESKLLHNIIIMLCYRAETALARLLAPHYKRADDEIRMLVKAIIRQTVDIKPDYQNNMLYITLYPLANNRSNLAVEKVIETINDTKTIFPGTNLMLNFKITTS